MKLSDLAVWWRLRRQVHEPWAATLLRKDRSPRVREVRFLDGRVVTLRCGTPDTQCFHHIFGCDEYRLDALPAGCLDTVIDVGAHVGLFAVKAAVLARRVVAIEPVEGNFRLLAQNVAASRLKNVKCMKACLAERDGTARIFIAGRNDGHSIYGSGSGPAETVPAFTLESVFRNEEVDRCSFLKLDCEGAEYAALFGAPKELLDRIGRIVLEYHPVPDPTCTGERLAAHLRMAGFEVEIQPGKKKTQGLIFANRKE